jgi:hypothetical protein
MTTSELTNEILILLKGLPITRIPDELKPQINHISEKVPLNEVFKSLEYLDTTPNDIELRVLFSILISRVDDLDATDLAYCFQWCLKKLEVPESKWIWFVDEYQAGKDEYIQQLAFKSRILGVLVLLRECLSKEGLNPSVSQNQDQLAWKLSWFFMKQLPWTDESIHNEAEILLRKLKLTDLDIKSLVPLIHEDFKSLQKSDKVTNAGYSRTPRFNNGLRPKVGLYEIENSRGVWKRQKIRSISTISYLLTQLSSRQLKEHWWLISPSVLNVLDDHEGPIKLLGVELLSQLLDVIDVDYLRLTKLGVIYYDSVKPLLTYLPKLTPTKLSCQILASTYPTLIKLSSKSSQNDAEYAKQLVDLLNSGVFSTMNAVRDNFEILKILLSQTIIIINELKLNTLKTLPRLIHHLGSVISDPFLDSSQELFLLTLDCLVAVEVNCWPRLYHNRFDLLAMISICYKKEKKSDEVVKKISEAWIVLKHVIENGNDEETFVGFINDVSVLCQRDSSLAELFI